MVIVRFLVNASFVLCLLLSAMIVTASRSRCDTLPDSIQQQVQPSRIAFLSRRDGDLEIYTIMSDGTDLQQITRNNADENAFAWSPDGRKIAFASWRDGNGEIYVMDADGRNAVNLTQNAAMDYEPAWSPDGSTIAFASDRGGVHGIYRIDVATGETYAVMNVAQAQNMFLGWSPDGATLAYTSTSLVSGGTATFLGDVSGRNIRTFASISPYRTLTWLPDGSALTRLTDDRAGLELVSENLVRDVRLLSDSYESMAFATFSPDGRSLAYIATNPDELTPSLFVSGAYGCNVREIWDSIRDPRSISWSPDSHQLLLVMGIDLFVENVYVVNADGSDVFKLIEQGDDFTSPAWQPPPAG